jgi:hypothetical protein
MKLENYFVNAHPARRGLSSLRHYPDQLFRVAVVGGRVIFFATVTGQ